MKTFESSIDKPQVWLDEEVWMKTGDVVVLRPEAEAIVMQVIQQAAKTFKLTDYTVHIIGSIASNQWTPTTDIDLHFCCSKFNAKHADEFNKLFRSWFKEVYTAGGMASKVALHPIEVYMQPNEFQDYMSVGCYDVFEKKWEVGPYIVPQDYQPLAVWFEVDMAEAQQMVNQLRTIILQCYETSRALLDLIPGTNAFDSVADMLDSYITQAKIELDKVKQSRKIASEPKSKEEAIALRNSKEWQLHDTTFKLLDKFGYLAILKTCAENVDRFHEDDSDKLLAARQILAAVSQNLNPNSLLADSQQICESARKSYKIWVDDIRPAPEGYVHIKSVDSFIEFVEQTGVDSIEVVDLDHDAGEYQKDGGDYIKILDWLEFSGAEGLKVRIHSANPVGRANMQRIIKKNGWTEVFNILEDDSLTWRNEEGIAEADIKFKCKVIKVKENSKDAWSVKTINPEDGGWVATFHDEEAAKSFAEEYPALKTKYMKKAKQATEAEELDEGAKEWLSLAAICGMLAIPGILPSSALAAEMKKVPKQQLSINSHAIKDAIKNASQAKSVNGLNAANIVNAVARTIYAEAKGEGYDGQAAIASVIWNRAGGKAENLVPVISKKKQFSCWNEYSGGWKDTDYKLKVPSPKELSNTKSKAAWENCLKLATKLFNGTFTSTIGNRNSYMNKSTADQSNINSWGKKLDKKIGRHHFGYLSYNDGFKSQNTPAKTYIVKAGDTLWSIAKANNMSIAELKDKNKLLDPNKISIGQKLTI